MRLQLTGADEAPTPWRGVVVAGVFALWPLVAWGGHLGHAPLVALGGLLTVYAWKGARPVPPLVLLAALVGWATLSTAWSTAPTGGFTLESYEALERRTWLKLVLQFLLYVAFVLAAAGLTRIWSKRVAGVMGWTAVALSVLLVVEALTGAKLYQAFRDATGDPYRADLALRNVSLGGYALAVLAWPAVAALRALGRRRLAILPVLAALLTPLAFGAAAPLAAFLAASVVFFLVRLRPRSMPRRLGYLLAAATVLAPLLIWAASASGVLDGAAPHVGASWAERIRIWSFATDQIARSPFFGLGLDASRTFGAAIPLHPHDAPLQIWLELGAVGAAITALFWTVLFAGCGRLGGDDSGAVASACAAAAAYFVVGALSFGVWQEWWLAVGALAAAAVLVVVRARTVLTEEDPTPILLPSEAS